MEDKIYLCFIRLIGEENDGYYRYEFIFTNDIDNVWGEEFDQKPACLVNNLIVDDEFITEIHIVKMKIKLDLIQNNCCFSVSDCYDGIVSIAWQNLDDEYITVIHHPETYKSHENEDGTITVDDLGFHCVYKYGSAKRTYKKLYKMKRKYKRLFFKTIAENIEKWWD